jgi:hypothetical protein
LFTIKTIVAGFENKNQQLTIQNVEKEYLKKPQESSLFEYCEKLIESFKNAGNNGNAIVYQILV